MAETVIHMLRGGTDNRRAFYCVFWGLVQRRGECAPVIESVFMRCALKARNRARIKPCNRRILCYIPRRFCRSSYAKQRKQNNRPMCWEWNKREPFGICIHGPLCKMTSLFPPAKLFAPFLRQAFLLELFFFALSFFASEIVSRIPIMLKAIQGKASTSSPQSVCIGSAAKWIKGI